MGYTTEFTGHVTPPLNGPEMAYLRQFAATRRMNRRNGPYYLGTGPSGQDHENDIVDYNNPSEEQPGLWCNWVPTDDGCGIQWDGSEKFYDAAEWMRYLIDTFLMSRAYLEVHILSGHAARNGWHLPAGVEHFTFNHVVAGTIDAQGEDDDDRWQLVVADNEVTVNRLPTIAEQVAADPGLRAAVDRLRDAGITVSQFATLTGQEY